MVTCPPPTGNAYEEMVEAACRGGADLIQLREKTMPAGPLVLLAKKLRKICRKYRVPLLVDDRPDVALAAGCDGVHLGHEDLPVPAARRILGRNAIIGRSAHSLEQAKEAQRLGCDYVSCGPIFATPTKPEYPAVGLDLVREYARHIRIPFVAIGGIDENNLREVLAAGAKSVAVVRAVCGAVDPEAAARRLKKILRG